MGNFFEEIRKKSDLSGIYRGKVLDNNDPDKLGRVKIEIYPSLAGISADALPWAVPASPLYSGAGDNCGSLYIPVVGSFVFVFFEGGYIEQPVYFAEAQTAGKGLPAERLTDYPNTLVTKTEGGCVISINQVTNQMTLTHPSGTSIDIDSTGKVSIKAENIVLGSDSGGSPLITVGDIAASATYEALYGNCILPLPTAGTKKVKGI